MKIKSIGKMTDRETLKSGMMTGSIIAGVSLMAPLYKPDTTLVFSALAGFFLTNLSALGLIEKKLQEIQEEVETA